MNAETPEPQSLNAGTEYIVLGKGALTAPTTDDPSASRPQTWMEMGRASARSAPDAIREVVATIEEGSRKGTFVAVPVRSWNPVAVSEKVERTLVIGG